MVKKSPITNPEFINEAVSTRVTYLSEGLNRGHQDGDIGNSA